MDTGGVFTTISAPGPSVGNTEGYGINDAGQVVGYYNQAGQDYGFLEIGGAFTTIPDPLGSDTVAHGIDNAGQIVGYYYSLLSPVQGFLDVGGVFTTIDYPGAPETALVGINNLGQILGYTNSTGFVYAGGNFTTFNYSGMSSTIPTGINDSGEIVGYAYLPEPSTVVLVLPVLFAMTAYFARKHFRIARLRAVR